MNPTSICEDAGSIPGPAQRVRIWHGCELQFKSQTWLRSGVVMAVAVAGSYSSDFFFFFFFRAALAAYGGSQARGLIGAIAAGLHHSHSNARSELHL